MAEEKNQDKMFISLDESHQASLFLAEEIQRFFETWGINCFVAKKDKELVNPEEKVRDRLKESNFFLQIINDMPRTKWMQTEWDIAQYQHHVDKKTFFLPIVISTVESSKADFEGKCMSARIDDEKQIETIFTGIIQERKNKEKCGNIFVPESFRSKEPGKIDLFGLLRFIGNFKEVHEEGLERIYSSSQKIVEHLRKKLVELGEQNGEVRMLGFTLKRFVIPDEDNLVGMAFKTAIEKGATAKLLLLERDCRAARERTNIESPDKSHEESLLVTDSRKVEKEYLHERYTSKVDIRYYETPYFGMVLFDDEAFVETYNLGTEIEGEKLKEGFCGQVPIMVIRANSFLYPLYSSHFQRVWDKNPCQGNGITK